MSGAIRECSIQFKEHKTIYHPGEKVFGKICLEICEQILCGRIHILFRGIAKVLWTETSSNFNEKFSPLKFSNEELLFNEKRCVFIYIDDDNGKQNKIRIYKKAQLKLDGKQNVWVNSDLVENEPEGTHGTVTSAVGGRARLRGETVSFDFSFRLPKDLPPSFRYKGSPAQIQYFVEVSSAGSFHDMNSKKAFITVAPNADVTQVSEVAGGCFKEETVEFKKPKYSLSNIVSKTDDEPSPKTLTVAASISKQAFAPGETIAVTLDADVANSGGRKQVKSIVVQLRLIVNAYARDPEHRKEITEHVVSSVRKCFETQRREITAAMVINAFKTKRRNHSENELDAERRRASTAPAAPLIQVNSETALRPIASNDRPLNRFRAIASEVMKKNQSDQDGETTPIIGHQQSQLIRKGERISLYVPETVISFILSNVVTVSYKVVAQVFIHREGPPVIEIDLPITIGTSPTNSTNDGGVCRIAGSLTSSDPQTDDDIINLADATPSNNLTVNSFHYRSITG